jgi:hypothetical protein
MNHYQHFVYADRYTTHELNQATQIARALEARDAARQALSEYHHQQRSANLMVGWVLFAFGALVPMVPAICWWILS